MNLYVYEKNTNGGSPKGEYKPCYSFAKTRYQIISHFLKGVHWFRPDLRIDARAYEDFYLNEKTFCFDPAVRRKDFVIKLIAMVVFILVMAVSLYMTV